MIIYKLTFKSPAQDQGEKLFTVEAVKAGKLREELGRIFDWSGYASSAGEEDDAAKDRRFQRVFETVLMEMANNKIPNTNITHKGHWVSLACMEVA
jgi:hypothetical protein